MVYVLRLFYYFNVINLMVIIYEVDFQIYYFSQLNHQISNNKLNIYKCHHGKFYDMNVYKNTSYILIITIVIFYKNHNIRKKLFHVSI